MAQWPVWRLAGAGLTPMKVNPVLMRGVNDDQAAELLRFCGSPAGATEAVRHGICV